MLLQICQCCGAETPALKSALTNEGVEQLVCPTCAMRLFNEKQTNESKLLKG